MRQREAKRGREREREREGVSERERENDKEEGGGRSWLVGALLELGQRKWQIELRERETRKEGERKKGKNSSGHVYRHNWPSFQISKFAILPPNFWNSDFGPKSKFQNFKLAPQNLQNNPFSFKLFPFSPQLFYFTN